MEGIWSGGRRYGRDSRVVVITVVTCFSVVLVLVLIVFIYAQKHRSEKRDTLSRTVKTSLIEEYA